MFNERMRGRVCEAGELRSEEACVCLANAMRRGAESTTQLCVRIQAGFLN